MLNWEQIAALIISIGVPGVQQIISLWENKAPVNSATFQQIIASAQQATPKQIMASALAAKGLQPTDPQYVNLMALIS